MVVGRRRDPRPQGDRGPAARPGGAAAQADRLPRPHPAGVRPRRGAGPQARACCWSTNTPTPTRPGSRHPKRWQDVEELLAAGIDVWTTLNVQHLESLVDVVWKITGVRQRETVPDSAPCPRRRDRAGRHHPGRAARAAGRGQGLSARDRPAGRRQLLQAGEPDGAARTGAAPRRPDRRRPADRRHAPRGRRGALGGRRAHPGAGRPATPWPASLVRAGRRLSDMMMDAPWTVAHVERPNRAAARRPAAAQQLREALKLAEQLGGATVVLTGDDLVGRGAGLRPAQQRHPDRDRQVARQPLARAVRPRRWPPPCCSEARGAALHIVTERGGDRAPSRAAPAAPAASLRSWRGHLGALGLRRPWPAASPASSTATPRAPTWR